MEPCVVSVQKNFPGEWPTDQELLPSLLSIDRLEYEEGKKANEMNNETSPLELVDRAIESYERVFRDLEMALEIESLDACADAVVRIPEIQRQFPHLELSSPDLQGMEDGRYK